jgi:hypothetical protein
VHRGELLVALFLAPMAFSAQVVGGYVIAARLCVSVGDAHVPLLILHLAAAIAAIAGFGMAVVLWRRTRHEKSGDVHQAVDRGDGRSRFLAICGFCASLIFLLAVLINLSAALLLGSCSIPLPPSG